MIFSPVRAMGAGRASDALPHLPSPDASFDSPRASRSSPSFLLISFVVELISTISRYRVPFF